MCEVERCKTRKRSGAFRGDPLRRHAWGQALPVRVGASIAWRRAHVHRLQCSAGERRVWTSSPIRVCCVSIAPNSRVKHVNGVPPPTNNLAGSTRAARRNMVGARASVGRSAGGEGCKWRGVRGGARHSFELRSHLNDHLALLIIHGAVSESRLRLFEHSGPLLMYCEQCGERGIHSPGLGPATEAGPSLGR